MTVIYINLSWFLFQGDLSDHFAKFVTTISGVKQIKPLTKGQMKILRNIILVSTTSSIIQLWQFSYLSDGRQLNSHDDFIMITAP